MGAIQQQLLHFARDRGYNPRGQEALYHAKRLEQLGLIEESSRREILWMIVLVVVLGAFIYGLYSWSQEFKGQSIVQYSTEMLGYIVPRLGILGVAAVLGSLPVFWMPKWKISWLGTELASYVPEERASS